MNTERTCSMSNVRLDLELQNVKALLSTFHFLSSLKSDSDEDLNRCQSEAFHRLSKNKVMLYPQIHALPRSIHDFVLFYFAYHENDSAATFISFESLPFIRYDTHQTD